MHVKCIKSLSFFCDGTNNPCPDPFVLCVCAHCHSTQCYHYLVCKDHPWLHCFGLVCWPLSTVKNLFFYPCCPLLQNSLQCWKNAHQQHQQLLNVMGCNNQKKKPKKKNMGEYPINHGFKAGQHALWGRLHAAAAGPLKHTTGLQCWYSEGLLSPSGSAANSVLCQYAICSDLSGDFWMERVYNEQMSKSTFNSLPARLPFQGKVLGMLYHSISSTSFFNFFETDLWVPDWSLHAMPPCDGHITLP